MALPAHGSIAAHDALVLAYTAWRGAEGQFDAHPYDRFSKLYARTADVAWLFVVKHAVNCGCSLTEPSVLTWVRRRIATYGNAMGKDVEAVLLPASPFPQFLNTGVV